MGGKSAIGKSKKKINQQANAIIQETDIIHRTEEDYENKQH